MSDKIYLGFCVLIVLISIALPAVAEVRRLREVERERDNLIIENRRLKELMRFRGGKE